MFSSFTLQGIYTYYTIREKTHFSEKCWACM